MKRKKSVLVSSLLADTVREDGMVEWTLEFIEEHLKDEGPFKSARVNDRYNNLRYPKKLEPIPTEKSKEREQNQYRQP